MTKDMQYLLLILEKRYSYYSRPIIKYANPLAQKNAYLSGAYPLLLELLSSAFIIITYSLIVN